MSDVAPDQNLTELENQVRETLEQGEDIQELVRQLTLRKMGEVALDLSSLKRIAEATIRGAKVGVAKEMVQPTSQAEVTRKRLTEAVSGLDSAMGQFALATRLALEEAAGRALVNSAEELARLGGDLANLDVMLLEILRNAATSAQGASREILQELAQHLSTQGTFAGAQAKETLSVLAHQAGKTSQTHLQAGLHLTQGTVGFLRKFAAGALDGLSERIKPNQKSE